VDLGNSIETLNFNRLDNRFDNVT